MRVYEGKITKGQKIQITEYKRGASGLGAYVSTPYLSNKSDEVSTGEDWNVNYGSKRSVDGLQGGRYHNRMQKSTEEPISGI